MTDKKYKDHYLRKADHEIPKTRCPVETFAMKYGIDQEEANKLIGNTEGQTQANMDDYVKRNGLKP